MRYVISNDLDKCVGCNRCVRNCPIDEANITSNNNGVVTVHVDNRKCIACGECLKACNHGSRSFEDDTGRFFNDLQNGVPISLFAAPAAKSNFDDFGRVFAWLRQLGVRKIYDVSLGADICTWAHIRYLQKHGLNPLITQPCPAIVNYILMHHNELLRYLSPVHSPMLCTAVYMKKYEGINTKIAALSPCIAKSTEFESTGNLVHYNVTLTNLLKYIEEHHVSFPAQASGFDHYEAGLGSLYSMPGGLKENVEHYLGKSVRVDKCEGAGAVYKALDEYGLKPLTKLPVIFDVLNCAEGCNIGTGCPEGKDIFDVNTAMDGARQASLKGEGQRYLNALYEKFDKTLRLDDFIRHYAPTPVKPIPITPKAIDDAFAALGKTDESSRNFNCGACGNDTCLEMAKRIAKGINLPLNCIQKTHADALLDRDAAMSELKSLDFILKDTVYIKSITDKIVGEINHINEAFTVYNATIKDIEKIALQVNLISMNASIEAARAGQHGKAFGVVAEEIRRLAQTTDSSAKNTQSASSKADTAIHDVTDMVTKISASINASYDNVTALAEKTKKTLKN
ncbi:MAG: methyl-accepting chemotaxis protein [Clostridiales bacterium]|jgi:NAD-dependent dihydropyrimidine dehydrogenase PreA subunit|nr:methyl-accepting chemotaxis protein [Clostridiales bacterium]